MEGPTPPVSLDYSQAELLLETWLARPVACQSIHPSVEVVISEPRHVLKTAVHVQDSDSDAALRKALSEHGGAEAARRRIHRYELAQTVQGRSIKEVLFALVEFVHHGLGSPEKMVVEYPIAGAGPQGKTGLLRAWDRRGCVLIRGETSLRPEQWRKERSALPAV